MTNTANNSIPKVSLAPRQLAGDPRIQSNAPGILHPLCPCCGARILSPTPAEIVAALALSPQQRRIAAALVARFGQYLSTRELAGVLYFDDPSGGPDGAEHGITVQMHYLRRKLADSPLMIPINSAGQRDGYKLTWRSAPVSDPITERST